MRSLTTIKSLFSAVAWTRLRALPALAPKSCDTFLSNSQWLMVVKLIKDNGIFSRAMRLGKKGSHSVTIGKVVEVTEKIEN